MQIRIAKTRFRDHFLNKPPQFYAQFSNVFLPQSFLHFTTFILFDLIIFYDICFIDLMTFYGIRSLWLPTVDYLLVKLPVFCDHYFVILVLVYYESIALLEASISMCMFLCLRVAQNSFLPAHLEPMFQQQQHWMKQSTYWQCVSQINWHHGIILWRCTS